MKDIYDKVFIGVGVLLVAGAAAFFFMGGSAGANTGGTMANNAYEPLELALQPEGQDDWDKPNSWKRSQDAEWEVFTPPKIYYDPNKEQFIFEPPRPIKPVPWCLELASLERPLYRVQYEGYVVTGSGPEGYLVLMTNPKTGAGVQGRPGQSLSSDGIMILSFEVSEEIKGGIMYKDTILKFRDDRNGREFTITNDEKVYDEGFTVAMRDTCNGDMFEWQEVGQTRTIAMDDGSESVYTLKDINLEANAVRIEQVHPDLSAPKELALVPVSDDNQSDTDEPQAEEQPVDDSSEGTMFDDLF